jgi:hypothetical protein
MCSEIVPKMSDFRDENHVYAVLLLAKAQEPLFCSGAEMLTDDMTTSIVPVAQDEDAVIVVAIQA